MDNEKLNELLVIVWDSLTDEQKAKAKACKTPDELIKLGISARERDPRITGLVNTINFLKILNCLVQCLTHMTREPVYALYIITHLILRNK